MTLTKNVINWVKLNPIKSTIILFLAFSLIIWGAFNTWAIIMFAGISSMIVGGVCSIRSLKYQKNSPVRNRLGWLAIVLILPGAFVSFYGLHENPGVKASINKSNLERENKEQLNNKRLSELNDYAKNAYKERMIESSQIEGWEYVGSKLQKSASSIDHFGIKDDKLVVYLYDAKLTGEGVSRDVAARYAMNNTVSLFANEHELPDVQNVKDNELDFDTKKNSKKYSLIS